MLICEAPMEELTTALSVPLNGEDSVLPYNAIVVMIQFSGVRCTVAA